MTDNAEIEKCKNFFSSVNINGRLRPNVIVMGMNAIVNADISGFFAANPMTTLLSNKLTISSMHPTGYRFGLFVTNKTENESRGTASAFLETDVGGHFSGQAHYDLSENLQAKTWGQWATSSSRADITGLLEWADRGFNTQIAGRVSTENETGKSKFTLVLDQVFRLSDNWTAGGQVTLGLKDSSRPVLRQQPSFFSEGTVIDCISLLRWDDGESNTMTGTLNKSMDAALRYQRRVNENISVGAELFVTNSSIKTSWLHRIELDKGLVITGQIGTDGTVVGNIRKKILPHFSVGISSSLNHMVDRFGVGIEIAVGPSPYSGSNPPVFRL